MNKLTLSTRSQDDDLDVVQVARVSPVFVVRDPQLSDNQSQQKPSMWKRTGNSKWEPQNNDAQTNRAGKWKSQP